MQALSLDLVLLYGTENSAGTGFHFPVTMKKTFTAPIILYPCVAPEHTNAATVNEIIAMGE